MNGVFKFFSELKDSMNTEIEITRRLRQKLGSNKGLRRGKMDVT